MSAAGPTSGPLYLTSTSTPVDPRQEPALAGSGQSATPGGSFTPAANLANGDYMLYVLSFNQNNLGDLVVTPPAGFDVVANFGNTDRNAIYVAARRLVAADVKSGLITLPNWRIADAGNVDQSRNYVTMVAVARNVHLTTPVAGSAGFGAISPQASGNSGTTAITDLPLGGYLLAFFSTRPSQATANVNLDAANSLPSSGWVKRVEQAAGTAGGGASIEGVAFSQVLGANSVSQAKLAVTFGTAAAYTAVVLELAPAAVGSLTGGSRGPSQGLAPSVTLAPWIAGTLPPASAAGASTAAAISLTLRLDRVFSSVISAGMTTANAQAIRRRLPSVSAAGAASSQVDSFVQVLPPFSGVHAAGGSTASAGGLALVLRAAPSHGQAAGAAASLRRHLPAQVVAGTATALAPALRMHLSPVSAAGSAGAVVELNTNLSAVMAQGLATTSTLRLIALIQSVQAPGAATTDAEPLLRPFPQVISPGSSTGLSEALFKLSLLGQMTVTDSVRSQTGVADLAMTDSGLADRPGPVTLDVEDA